MTQLRKFRDSISNYFDEVERGVGKRGSTFTDVDAISHDKDTRRFLFREFKNDGEPLDQAQLWVLRELAGLPRCTVWIVRRLDTGLIGWTGVVSSVNGGGPEVVLTIDEYRERLKLWWYPESDRQSATPQSSACIHKPEYMVNGKCWVCEHLKTG